MPSIWIDFNEFEDDDLAEELLSRGHKVIFAGDEEEIDEDNERLKTHAFELMKSYTCDSQEVFDRNMRIFIDRWYKEI